MSDYERALRDYKLTVDKFESHVIAAVMGNLSLGGLSDKLKIARTALIELIKSSSVSESLDMLMGAES